MFRPYMWAIIRLRFNLQGVAIKDLVPAKPAPAPNTLKNNPHSLYSDPL